MAFGGKLSSPEQELEKAEERKGEWNHVAELETGSDQKQTKRPRSEAEREVFCESETNIKGKIKWGVGGAEV